MRVTGLVASLALLSCSGISSRAWVADGGWTPNQGYTACGDTICNPNEYCDNPNYGSCMTGCKADENCTSDLQCAHTGTSAGECRAPVVGAREGEICTAAGYCDGKVYYCYFGKLSDLKGTCRLPCTSGFECGQADLYSYDCCPTPDVSSYSVCVPGYCP